jgi:hypothetical protein
LPFPKPPRASPPPGLLSPPPLARHCGVILACSLKHRAMCPRIETHEDCQPREAVFGLRRTSKTQTKPRWLKSGLQARPRFPGSDTRSP